jgi:hypothetical protein
VRIGDYGLSRRISGSEGGDLSRGVGTPHYMAPEIKNGNYTASIDVYACGIILFEMISGHRPFDGETPMEVLMKHYLDKPDLAPLPAAYREVIGRALEKDPTKRYGSVVELAKAVDEMLRGGRREASAVPPPLPKSEPRPSPAKAIPTEVPPGTVMPVATPVALPRTSKLRSVPTPPPSVPLTTRDRLTALAGGFALTPLVTAACTAPWAAFQSSAPWSLLGRVFLLSTVLAWAVILLGRLPRRSEGSPWGRRAIQLAVGLGIGALAFWLDGWAMPNAVAEDGNGDMVRAGAGAMQWFVSATGMQYLFYFGLTVALCRWWKATDRRRKERVRFIPLIAAGFWSAVFLFLWPGDSSTMWLGVSVLVIAMVAAQVASPWAGPPLKSRA